MVPRTEAQELGNMRDFHHFVNRKRTQFPRSSRWHPSTNSGQPFAVRRDTELQNASRCLARREMAPASWRRQDSPKRNMASRHTTMQDNVAVLPRLRVHLLGGKVANRLKDGSLLAVESERQEVLSADDHEEPGE